MKKLLIIDDERLIRLSLAKIFKRHNYEVMEAEDGEIGLQLWQQFEPDIVLLDWIMPVKNGKEVCISDTAIKSKAAIIVMSAYQNEVHRIDWADFGVKGFITKPFPNILELVNIVNGYTNE